jgi:riboflavin synthase
MFTGIIESVGTIEHIGQDGSNKIFWIRSPISGELKVDQSVSHNGVCLTVEAVSEDTHRVTAIEETLVRSNFNDLRVKDEVNLERCMLMNGRIDGHIVQGHVDTTASCINKTDFNGSWGYRFSFPDGFARLVIEKGSIAINGISLTLFNVNANEFSVAVIPYTYAHTNLKHVNIGTSVNIEFDMIGKYIERMMTFK